MFIKLAESYIFIKSFKIYDFVKMGKNEKL